MASTSSEHKCVLCDARMESKPALQEHFRDHANGKIKPRQRRPGYLAQEVARKTGGPAPPPPAQDVSWQCDSCTETFPTVTAAITHKFKVHPNSMTKYYCPYCGQQFPLKMSFDLHVKTHKHVGDINETPCTECDAVFYVNKARDFHFNSVHSRSMSIIQPKFCPPPSMKIDVSQSGEMRSCYYCHLCGTEYTVKYNLVRHLDRHDQADRDAVPGDVIRCNRCTSVFFNERAYSAHLLRHQDGDLFVASEEQRLMVVDRVDQDLDLTRIPNPLDRYVPGEGSAGPRQRPPAAKSRSKRPAERGDDSAAKSVRAS
ncbi:zinc finger protein 574-like [Pollicipes pollicipes]|uniref:zinc finger protein 574-like n=1 Tax=Pollicipes pollicipes TaxID=41117 RepID=UPI00188527C8|nr:zinc finger protein 574-like [Pollicipes pollicipes]